MMIKVLGAGCTNCRKLDEMVRQTVAEMGMDARVEKKEDLAEIVKHGVMSTPALVVDEEVVVSGRVPSKAELNTMLINAQLASEAESRGS